MAILSPMRELDTGSLEIVRREADKMLERLIYIFDKGRKQEVNDNGVNDR